MVSCSCSPIASGQRLAPSYLSCLHLGKEAGREGRKPEAAGMNRNNCWESQDQVTVSDGPSKEVLTLIEAASLLRCSKAHLLNVVHLRVPNVPPIPHARVG